MRLSFGEKVVNLKLSREVVKRNSLIADRTPGEVGIHSNMLGQVILDQINSNLQSLGTVTMERSRSHNENTKVLQHPAKPNHLLNNQCKCTNLDLNAGADDSGLLLGPPHNQRRVKK